MEREPFKEAISGCLRLGKAGGEIMSPSASLASRFWWTVRVASRPFVVVPALFRPRSGTHQRRFQHQQPFEVKRHGLQEGCELILRHPTVAHALRPLSKHPFVRRSQMRLPPVAIPVLRDHVVPLDRRQMTAPPGRSMTHGAVQYLSAYTAPCGTDMPQGLGIRKIRRGRGHFVDQAGLPIALTCSL